MSTQTASLAVKVTPDIRSDLKEIAEARKVSVHRLLSDLVKDFVEISKQDLERERQAVAIAEHRRDEIMTGRAKTLTLDELKSRINASVSALASQSNG